MLWLPLVGICYVGMVGCNFHVVGRLHRFARVSVVCNVYALVGIGCHWLALIGIGVNRNPIGWLGCHLFALFTTAMHQWPPLAWYSLVCMLVVVPALVGTELHRLVPVDAGNH